MKFRSIIIFSVLSVFLFFSSVIYLVVNSVYLNSIKKQFFDENILSTKIIYDYIKKEKNILAKEAEIIGENQMIYFALEKDIYLWNLRDDKKEKNDLKMDRYKFNIMVNRIKTDQLGPLIELALYDKDFLVKGKTNIREFLDKGNENYFNKIKKNGATPYAITFLQNRKNKIALKSVYNIPYAGKNIGAVVLVKKLDSNFFRELKNITNKEIIFLRDEKIIFSSLFYDKSNKIEISKIKNRNKSRYSNVTINKKKMIFTFINLLDYNNQVIGKIGIGFSLNKVYKIYKKSLFKFIVFLFIFSTFIFSLLIIIMNKIFNPFDKIIENINEIKDGVYKEKVNVNYPIELKKVSDAVLNLSKSVMSREEELKELNENINNKNVKLQQINNLKDEFLAKTSHELRTPLNGIIGITEGLLKGVIGDIDNGLKSQLNMILFSGKKLSILVNDILDLSKLKNKDIVINLNSCNIYKVFDFVIKLLKPLINNNQVKILNEIDKDNCIVLADENRILQVAYNLIGNSIKYTSSGFIKISSIKKDKYIEFLVEDTGIGIKKEEIGTIFDNFQQGENSQEGLGLGLAITNEIIELHNSKLIVESDFGRGSKFSFKLKIFDNEIIEEKKKTEMTPESSFDRSVLFELEKSNVDVIKSNINKENKGRILAIDDEIINLQVLINILSINGYKVETVKNGIQSLEIIKNKKNYYDLVILDIMMPEISGLEVCEEIRKLYNDLELPILLLTAKGEISNLLQGFKVGANDFLKKPVEIEELLARVNLLIKLKKAFEEKAEVLKDLNKAKQNKEVSEKLRLINYKQINQNSINDILKTTSSEIKNLCDFTFAYYYKMEKKTFIDIENQSKEDLKIEDLLINDKMKNILQNRLSKNNNIKTGFYEVYKEKNEYLLIFPIVFKKKNVDFFILVAKDRIKETEIDLIASICSQAEIAIDKTNMYMEVEKKSKELEKTINVLNSIEELSTIIYSEKNIKSGKDFFLFILFFSLEFDFDNIFYLDHCKKNNSLVSEHHIMDINKTKTETQDNYFEVYKKYKEFIKEQKRSNIHLEIDLNKELVLKEVIENNKFYIKNNNNDKFQLNYLNKNKFCFFPVIYEKQLIGSILIINNRKNYNLKDLEIITRLINHLSIYLNKRLIEEHYIKNEKERIFNCKNCGIKLFKYKGETEFVEVKCPRCNTFNKLKG